MCPVGGRLLPSIFPRQIVCHCLLIETLKLPGHTPGHFGVAIQPNGQWLLHAGDAYYDHRELTKSPMQIGLSLFQKVVHNDDKAAMKTQQSLRDLQSNPDVEIFCAHDPVELANVVGFTPRT